VGLSDSDPKPYEASSIESYDAIRSWYQANLDRFASDPVHANHIKDCRDYVEALQPGSKASEQQIDDLFHQVVMGVLECGYHQSDGHYKMAAYAEVGQQKRGSTSA
jgi:hypothetical protein